MNSIRQGQGVTYNLLEHRPFSKENNFDTEKMQTENTLDLITKFGQFCIHLRPHNGCSASLLFKLRVAYYNVTGIYDVINLLYFSFICLIEGLVTPS